MASLLSLSGVTFNLLSVQLSLTRQAPVANDSLAILESEIKLSRNHHKLYEFDLGRCSDVVRWANENLETAEVNHLSACIRRQREYFLYWYWSWARNAGLFLNKESNHCYCDPFTPEPKVYRGHLTFYDGVDLNERIGLEYDEFMDKINRNEIPQPNARPNRPEPYLTDLPRSDSTKGYLGQLKYRINEIKGTLTFTMKRKMYYKETKTFRMLPNKAQRFKNVLAFIQNNTLALVDESVRPIGRVWHSYSLRDFVNKLNSNDNIYYQFNQNSVMVATCMLTDSLNNYYV